MPEPLPLVCPCCGESFETAVDLSSGGQSYIEDCPVCCRPITIAFGVDASGALDWVRAGREGD
ncbi:MAG: CPXCG motif-containing cysteine-rich protein [Xanthomonadaceae bacterium]|nr:CPXCG motif-containing cysteine-rich protein [Xanthomonadaceae bacterium]MDE1958156.1 CPXCG motif-containing cysteine-rich protein [Xanthomonadaceae bacterium]MDE2176745.1 CPXCG motif-containing cysteine-rich protein [Xanthomonadaceae bacterium]MDE2245376.1 CPXCG motif-containing cysteine-rich protein [Xanthomonadaceae bacterium]